MSNVDSNVSGGADREATVEQQSVRNAEQSTERSSPLPSHSRPSTRRSQIFTGFSRAVGQVGAYRFDHVPTSRHFSRWDPDAKKWVYKHYNVDMDGMGGYTILNECWKPME